MKMLKVFTVYDSKSESYLKPFYMRSRGEAIRGFTDIANDPKTEIGKYPSDFTLFEIGSFDEQSGVLGVNEAKASVCLASELIKAQVFDSHLSAVNS